MIHAKLNEVRHFQPFFWCQKVIFIYKNFCSHIKPNFGTLKNPYQFWSFDGVNLYTFNSHKLQNGFTVRFLCIDYLNIGLFGFQSRNVCFSFFYCFIPRSKYNTFVWSNCRWTSLIWWRNTQNIHLTRHVQFRFVYTIKYAFDKRKKNDPI